MYVRHKLCPDYENMLICTCSLANLQPKGQQPYQCLHPTRVSTDVPVPKLVPTVPGGGGFARSFFGRQSQELDAVEA